MLSKRNNILLGNTVGKTTNVFSNQSQSRQTLHIKEENEIIYFSQDKKILRILYNKLPQKIKKENIFMMSAATGKFRPFSKILKFNLRKLISRLSAWTSKKPKTYRKKIFNNSSFSIRIRIHKGWKKNKDIPCHYNVRIGQCFLKKLLRLRNMELSSVMVPIRKEVLS